MVDLDPPTTAARSAIAEILENSELTQRLPDLLFSNADKIFLHAYYDHAIRAAVDDFLKLRRADVTPVYRGLYLQLGAIFERYFKSLCERILLLQVQRAATYDNLPKVIRDANLLHTGAVFQKVHDPVIAGQHIDFQTYVANIATCQSGSTSVRLNVDAFHLFLGNCTPDRIDKALAELSVPVAFWDRVGAQKVLQNALGLTKSRETANTAKSTLKEYMTNRNAIIHRNATMRIVTATECTASARFFDGLVAAFTAAAKQL